MTIPGWLVILVIILIGIRQIFRYTKSTHRITKKEKLVKQIDELEADLQKHEHDFEDTPAKSNVIQFPNTPNK